jgi:hypothetical protein
MKSASPLDFGQFIAYLVPGFVAFYAFTNISPEAKEVFDLSVTPETGVSAELGIGLFSIAAGIIISAIRDFVLDEVQFRTGVSKPDLNWAKLSDEGVNNAFKGAIDNVYRFAQFCGNMFVAVFILVGFRIYNAITVGNGWPTTLILIASLLCLFIAHRRQLRQTYKTLSEILA